MSNPESLTKKCKCGTRPVSEFSTKGNGRLQAYCRSCQNEHTRKWYKDNKKQQLKNVYARRARYKKELDEFVFTFLSNHPCVDCGESDIIVLDFDHIKGEKIKSISQMVADGTKLSSVVCEIEKCQVRCANCHRRQTFSRGQYSRWKWCSRRELNSRLLD